MVLCGVNRSAEVYQCSTREVRQQKSALTRMVCVMYCMVFCVFGFVFPICDVLTKTSGAHHLYSEIFLTLVMGLSIVILGYFFLFILRQGGKSSAEAGREELELRAIQNSHASSGTSINVQVDGKPNGASNGTQEQQEISNDPRSSTEVGPPLSMAEEGLNLYTRVGTVVFAIGALLLKIFRLIEPFTGGLPEGCVSKVFIMVQVVFLIFLVMETVFIFIFHQVVINKHKPFVRLCLMHLIATNLSVWLAACTTEIVEDVGEMFAEAEKGSKEANQTIRCHDKDTLTDHMAPYTFPCLIEFSLIAAAAAFRMYLNVGKVIEEEEQATEVTSSQKTLTSARSEHEDVTCSSFKSLFHGFDNLVWTVSGVVISSFVVVGVVIFLVIREGHLHPNVNLSTYLYLSSDLVAMFGALVAVGFGFGYIAKLKFRPLEEGTFDDKLLILAQFGVFTYSTMLAISCSANLALGFMDTMYLYLIRAVLNFVQSGIQTIFVLSSMRRCAGHDDQVRNKPGRACVLFLIMVNLALWLVNTFEMEKAEVSGVKVQYFDRVSWSIVSHMLIPLVIFYRYHTTVCLSDVFVKAYEKPEKEE